MRQDFEPAALPVSWWVVRGVVAVAVLAALGAGVVWVWRWGC